MAERVTVQRAAEILGTSALTVRWGIIEGTLPIGSAIKSSKHRTCFHISPHLLAQYLGLPIEEVLEGSKAINTQNNGQSFSKESLYESISDEGNTKKESNRPWQQYIADEHDLAVLKAMSTKSDDVLSMVYSAFYYGCAQGQRAERARRN